MEYRRVSGGVKEGATAEGGSTAEERERKGGNYSFCSSLPSAGPEQRGDYLSLVPVWCSESFSAIVARGAKQR